MTRAPPLSGAMAPHPAALRGVLGFYHRWRKRRRDRADLAAMNEIELHDIGRATAHSPDIGRDPED